MDMSPETIKALLDAFDRSDWREMTVTVGNDRLYVSRDPSPNGDAPSVPAPAPEAASAAENVAPPAQREAPPALAPVAAEPHSTAAAPGPSAPAEGGATATAPPEGTVIESPSVGLFWRAPAPGAPPFVEVGDRVSSGDTVAIVEVMKLMNHVVSPVDGLVSAILVDNGAPVEFGQAIVVVNPNG